MRGLTGVFLAGLILCSSGAAYSKGVTEDDLRSHIKILASDEFEGRKPGTEGEAKTVKYIAEQWAKAGLKPAANDGSWFEPVSLVQRGQGGAEYAFTAKARKLRIGSDEIVLIGKEPSYAKKDLQVIFTGVGVKSDGSVVADVAGKAALVMVDAENVPDDMKSPRARREALVAAGAEEVSFVASVDGRRPRP